jgi:16S rRNA (uracil1498-N3)-methyltransferase
MTIHRFYIPEIEIKDTKIVLPAEISHQITKVLRLNSGDIIIVFDNTQMEYTVMLEEVNRQTTIGRVIKQKKNNTEPETSVYLCQSLLPREKFEEVLQKGTQAGICAFFPIETERTVVKTKDIREEKLQRWQKIAQEAAEQSERGIVPEVHQSKSFQQGVEQASEQGAILIAWEREENNFPSAVLPKLSKAKHVSLFIGPEGGFTKEEIDFAKSKGAQTISLGPRILKSETAGVILASLVLFSFGELDYPTN